MRLITCLMLIAAVAGGVLILSPVQAATVLDCRPGARYVLAGVGPPTTALLLLFGGSPVGGGTTDAQGAYRLTLTVGREAPGVYSVDVVTRGEQRLIASATCIVTAPNAPTAPPRPPATAGSTPPTATLPPTVTPFRTATSGSIVASATFTAIPSATTAGGSRATTTTTATPSASSTATASIVSGSAPSATTTASATATATASATTTGQSGGTALLTIAGDSTTQVGEVFDLYGRLTTANNQAIASTKVTVYYSYDGVDKGEWCSDTTDSRGDWSCSQTIDTSLQKKTLTLTASADVQGVKVTAVFKFTPADPQT